METCVCKYCNKLFRSHKKATTCRECIPIANKQFKIVEEYLIKHPGSNTLELAGGLNVKVAEIIEYINEGRLVIMNSGVQIPHNK